MSLFKNIFGSSEEGNQSSKIVWRQLTDLGQLNEIIDLSNEKAVLIFKHSTRCSISRFALKQFENEFDLEEKITPYFLDLLNHRDVSNEVANLFDVFHQSPQILLIKNGKAIFSTSHDDIDAKFLERFTV
ncbi:bacillithiol system redox-active protein YtxJ [Flavobacterium chungnamense]|uniref:Bacillithiol system redox-active protein YtxJ n=1 Tax=Flavobacterium chungnamense TaxID=706182 RepID=A0ABP7UFG0_9FLAO